MLIPNDLLLEILEFLRPPEVMLLGRACMDFYQRILKNQLMWRHLYRQHQPHTIRKWGDFRRQYGKAVRSERLRLLKSVYHYTPESLREIIYHKHSLLEIQNKRLRFLREKRYQKEKFLDQEVSRLARYMATEQGDEVSADISRIIQYARADIAALNQRIYQTEIRAGATETALRRNRERLTIVKSEKETKEKIEKDFAWL